MVNFLKPFQTACSLAAVETTAAAVMAVDRTFTVRFVNDAARAILREHEAGFRTLWKDFSADRIVGMSIGTLHDGPPHQRPLVSDPQNLPCTTDITVGDVKFELTVAAVKGAFGRVIGYVLQWADISQIRVNEGLIKAINRAQAVIEFTPDGIVSTANENFLTAMGYTLEEIVGKHHRIFVPPEDAKSADYAAFWERLARGEFFVAKYHRVKKDGAPIIIEASYNPVFDRNGKIDKVVKFATDVTERERADRRRAENLSAVITDVADGLSRMSREDFSERLTRPFAAEYESLRADFNAAMDRLSQAAGERACTQEAVGIVTAELGAALERLSAGDLLFALDKPFPEGYDRLREDLNQTISVLKDGIAAMTRTAISVREKSAAISTAAVDMATRTESQAATLEEIAASTEELSQTVTTSAGNSAEARKTAALVADSAKASHETIQRAVEAMDAISVSSREINQIIGVIDDISFQTNLLALNAGVEAARAGDSGRGFAVVAQEVRALAQRSSQAAKEIKGLIATSTEQVGQGVEFVGVAGTAFRDILSSVTSLNGLVESIVAASEEQALALSQVSEAVGDLDKVTQQNLLMVQETTDASSVLAADATALMTQVYKYDTGMDRRSPHRQEDKPGTDYSRMRRNKEPAREPHRRPAPRPKAPPVAGNLAIADEADWAEF